MQAHLAPVRSMQDVEAVMSALLTNNKIQRATHNIMAYRIHVPDSNTHLQVCTTSIILQYFALVSFIVCMSHIPSQQGCQACCGCRTLMMMVRAQRGAAC